MSQTGWAQTLVTGEVDGTTLTAAAAASAIPPAAKFTLAPNFFNVGSLLYINAAGKMSSVITTPGTMRFDVRFGSTVVFDGLAVLLDANAAHTNVGWLLELWLTCRVIGTSAALMGHGKLTCESVKGSGTMPLGSLVANLPWNSTPANGNTFDSTASQAVDFFFTQTVATGSLTLQQYHLVSMN